MRKMRKIARWIALLAAAGMLAGCAAKKTGAAYLKEQEYQAAAECFTKEIADNKNLKEAWRGLGIASFELGEYRQAADAFEQALTHHAKKTASLCSLMGACYVELKEYETALDWYEDALEIEDCSKELRQEILYNQIAVYQELGDWETVKEKTDAYTEAYPEDDRMEKTKEFLETRFGQ